MEDYNKTTNTPKEAIQQDIPSNEDVMIHFDQYQLCQIVTNLLDNGLFHSQDHPSNPKILIKIYFKETNQSYYLDLINFGVTINKTDEKQLFEPFFTTHAAGTGLGLYIARELTLNNNAQLNHIPNNEWVCFRIRFGNTNKNDD
jgi:two-component system sensor histidine kinase PilS (NtrC family)